MAARSGLASSSSCVRPRAVSAAAKASLVGAKTVNGPGPESVSASPACWTAATRIEKSGFAAATSTIVPGASMAVVAAVVSSIVVAAGAAVVAAAAAAVSLEVVASSSPPQAARTRQAAPSARSASDRPRELEVEIRFMATLTPAGRFRMTRPARSVTEVSNQRAKPCRDGRSVPGTQTRHGWARPRERRAPECGETGRSARGGVPRWPIRARHPSGHGWPLARAVGQVV